MIKESGVHGSKVYPILDRLTEKGLVSHIKEGKKRVYSANPPHAIVEYIKSREQEIRELKRTAEQMVSHLETLSKHRPSEATVFFGVKGLRTASEKMYHKMKRGDTLYYLGIPADQPEEQHVYWQKDHKRREEHSIKVKLLFNKGTPKNVLDNRNSFKGSDARYMPSDIATPALFAIYKDVVLIMLQSPDVVTVEIINQHIADSFLAYFNEFWKRSKKID